MRLKIIDAIGVGIIAIGIVMTALLFTAVRKPAAGVESFTIHKIPSPGAGESLPWPVPHDRPA